MACGHSMPRFKAFGTSESEFRSAPPSGRCAEDLRIRLENLASLAKVASSCSSLMENNKQSLYDSILQLCLILLENARAIYAAYPARGALASLWVRSEGS